MFKIIMQHFRIFYSNTISLHQLTVNFAECIRIGSSFAAAPGIGESPKWTGEAPGGWGGILYGGLIGLGGGSGADAGR